MKTNSESCLNCGNDKCRFMGTQRNRTCCHYEKAEEVAYICDGMCKCSMEPTCFLRNDYVGKTDVVCHHTPHPEHAKNGPCADPENHPERFAFIPGGERIKYYERLPWEEI